MVFTGNATLYQEDCLDDGSSRWRRIGPPSLVKDGFCNDETNIAACNYDGGDCCGPDVSCKLESTRVTNLCEIL